MFLDAIIAIQNSSENSSIYVGADSIRFKKNDIWFAKYTTVIIVHLDSKHGAKVFHQTSVMPDYGNLRQRLMTEVQHAIEAASSIVVEGAQCRPHGRRVLDKKFACASADVADRWPSG